MITRRTVAETAEVDFTVEQALELADEWALSGELPAPLIVSLAWHLQRAQAIERRLNRQLGELADLDSHNDLTEYGRGAHTVLRYVATGEWSS